MKSTTFKPYKHSTLRYKFAYKAKPGSTPGIYNNLSMPGGSLPKTSQVSNRSLSKKSTAAGGKTGRRSKKPVAGKREPWMLDERSRVFPDGRQELRGIDRSNRRHEVFVRSEGRCEETVLRIVNRGTFLERHMALRCNRPITEQSMHWSHQPCIHTGVGNGHGRGFKCDAMSCGIASCKKCHERLHAGRKAA
jgi:hypothetical protein